ncbi:SAM-dependent methyltransferase [Desulfoluna spongiiphila]|uniref:Methyltransferase domain-containing protein n=1 Tax=Desulfoluna spongiiphila TaxID=419481 RepID=A0A1G5JNI2_9BACT|nr:SAM-dependent methyltransferase [Desulfoluna spongiiphila]SCY89887.1 Methyltransferase domain-containing protein [Desulfoluna spongiiphila]
MKAKDYLIAKLSDENFDLFGIRDPDVIDSVADAWMNDKGNSEHRFDTIKKFLTGASKILDMASGCGTCVYYGLLNGYDMHGVEPEKWKHQFNKLKAKEYEYPAEWQKRFSTCVGEKLPYKNNFFDCVTSYQTLEHVQDPAKCISEMIRVTRPGGGIHIQCPDYRSTYEGHYLLPWLPLFPQLLAKHYLKLMHRPVDGLYSINYVTKPKIERWVNEAALGHHKKVKVIDIEKHHINDKLIKFKLSILSDVIFYFYNFQLYFKYMFKREFSTNIFIFILDIE